MNNNLQKIGFFTDQRTPWIPTDPYLKTCLKEENSYPSPYPETIVPSIYMGENNYIESKEGSIRCQGSIYHSLATTSCVAFESIEVLKGSILVGKEIILKAPIVKICDTLEFPIRTTIIAKEHLIIETDHLILEGADIPPPKKITINIKKISINKVTKNTEWLINLIEKNSVN